MDNKQLVDFSKWGSIYGILAIVSGAFTCLSIIGAVIGIPMIFAGINMRKGALKAKSIIQRTADGEVISTEEYGAVIEEVGHYAKIMCIVSIVSYVLGIIFVVLYIFLILFIIFTGVSAFGGSEYYYY